MKQSQKVLCIVFFALAIAIILGVLSIRTSNEQILQTELRNNSIKKNFKNFDRVDISGKIKVTIYRSENSGFKMENFSLQTLNNLNIYQEGTTLYIKETDVIPNLLNKPNAQITLKMPTLNSIIAAEKSKIIFKNFTGKNLQINASDSSLFKAQNAIYDELIVNASGSTRLYLKKLIATSLNANLSNSAKMTVRMGNGKLIVNASDNSKLRYLGKPSDKQITTTESARVGKNK